MIEQANAHHTATNNHNTGMGFHAINSSGSVSVSIENALFARDNSVFAGEPDEALPT
jgi:hypothetical protein